MNHKSIAIKIILIPLIISAICFLALLALLIEYDHFHLREHDFYDANKFAASPDMRLQAMGIIKNVDFDSVILGTSMIETASAMQASKLLDGKFVNISVRGSNFYERAIIIRALFREKKIKTFIYSVEVDYTPTKEIANPKDWDLLYDENALNDLFVLFDANYVTGVLNKFLFSNISPDMIVKKHTRISHEPKVADIDFFDTPVADCVKEEDRASLFGGLSHWTKRLDISEIRLFLLQMLPSIVENTTQRQYPDDMLLNEIKKYIDENILSFVKKHPETRFDIVFPTHYRALYAFKLRTSGGIEYYKHQEVIKYMVEQAAKYDNLYVYGFEDQAFVDEIKNFKDINHYHADFNDFILESIAKGKHQLTLENIDAYLAKCEQLARDFDVQSLYDESQRLLREQNMPTTWDEYKKSIQKAP